MVFSADRGTGGQLTLFESERKEEHRQVSEILFVAVVMEGITQPLRGLAQGVPVAGAAGDWIPAINPGEGGGQAALKLSYQPHFLLSRSF
jgi:hypothetical protein